MSAGWIAFAAFVLITVLYIVRWIVRQSRPNWVEVIIALVASFGIYGAAKTVAVFFLVDDRTLEFSKLSEDNVAAIGSITTFVFVLVTGLSLAAFFMGFEIRTPSRKRKDKADPVKRVDTG